MDGFSHYNVPGAFLQPEMRPATPAELTRIRRGMCAIMKESVEEKYTMRRVQKEVEDFFREIGPREDTLEKIKMLREDDWKALAVAPSNWVSRAAMGLANKAPSVKRPQGGQIVQPHAFHQELKSRWGKVALAEKQKFLEVTESLAQSYEVRSFAFGEAAEKYRDAMALAREGKGEGTKEFLRNAQSFLRCVHLAKKSRKSFGLQLEAVRVYAKLMRMSTAETPSRICNQEDKDDLLRFLNDQVTCSALSNLVIFVASQLKHQGIPLCDAHRQLVGLWSFVLRDTAFWLRIDEEEYKRRETCHELMVAYLQHAGESFADLPTLPRFLEDPVISDKFLQDTTQDSAYLKNHPELVGLFRMCMDNREKAGTASETKRVAATLLITGPPATGKTASAKSLAHHLDVPLVKIDGVDIKSKWYGESAKALESYLKQSIAYAQLHRHANIVVMFDELDGIATKRDENQAHAGATSQDILMVLLDLIDPQELEYHYTLASGEVKLGHVVVVATSNVPEDLDGAMLGRFQCRIDMPRWSPDKNYNLLRDKLALLGREKADDRGLLQFSKKVGWREDASQWLTKMAVSRLDLRSLHAVGEVMASALNEQGQKDWGRLSWRLFAELKAARLSEVGGAGALVPNARYLYEEEFQVFEGTGKKAKSISIESNRVCLADLLGATELGLDLIKNPYPCFFDLRDESCLLVVHHLGATFVFLEDLKGRRKDMRKAIHGCFSGAFPERNRKKLTDRGLNYHQQFLLPGPREGAIDPEFLDERVRTTSIPMMKGFVQQENFPRQDKSPGWHTFLWSEIVEGAENFDQARDELTHREGGKATMSLEFLTEIDPK